MRSFLFLTVAVLFLGTSWPAFSLNTNPTDVPSGRYELDPDHASLVFRISHFGYSYYTGRFNVFDARLEVDSKNPENSKLDVTIDPASIDTNNPKLENELKTEKNLNISRFPQVTFRTRKIERTGPSTGTVEGDLTMLGVAQPVVMNVTFNGWGEHFMKKIPVIGFSATGSLKRSDFGYVNYLPMVGDEVSFEIQVEFHKAGT